MANSSEAVKEILLRENEEFQRLTRKHRELDSRLHALAERIFLSDEEKIEEVTLKKQKLAVKDKMADIIRRHEAGSASRPGPRPPSPPV